MDLTLSRPGYGGGGGAGGVARACVNCRFRVYAGLVPTATSWFPTWHEVLLVGIDKVEWLQHADADSCTTLGWDAMLTLQVMTGSPPHPQVGCSSLPHPQTEGMGRVWALHTWWSSWAEWWRFIEAAGLCDTAVDVASPLSALPATPRTATNCLCLQVTTLKKKSHKIYVLTCISHRVEGRSCISNLKIYWDSLQILPWKSGQYKCLFKDSGVPFKEVVKYKFVMLASKTSKGMHVFHDHFNTSKGVITQWHSCHFSRHCAFLQYN